MKNKFLLTASDNGVTTSYNGGTSNAYGLITQSRTTTGGKTLVTSYAKGNRLTENETTGGIYTSRQVITYYPNTNLIKQYGEWKFNYDRNGSLTARGKSAVEKATAEKSEEENLFASWNFDAGQGEVWYYEYDMSGRMTRSSSSKKGTEGLTERASYAYGRNGALTYEARVSGESIMASRSYAYLNDQIIGFTEKTSTGIERTCYTVTDITGTVTEVYDSDGNLLWKETYTAFGKASGTETDEFDEAFGFSAMFTGCQEDGETGLSYHWNRWRSEYGSSFITQDPARDGSNWWNYCNSNPVTYTDLNGLETEKYTLSADGIEFLKLAEGSNKDPKTGLLTVYNDSNGHATKGYGILLHHGTYTEEDKKNNPDQTETQAHALISLCCNSPRVEKLVMNAIRAGKTQDEVKIIWLDGNSVTSALGKRRINEWRIYYEGKYAEDPYK